jgi:choline dehydrogenase-like flavoprotein
VVRRGALALAPREFEADPARGFLPWPIAYDELAPFYEEAERLLAVRTFTTEPDLQRLVAGLRGLDAGWSAHSLKLGLDADILEHADEVRRFDGFARRGAEERRRALPVDRVRSRPNSGSHRQGGAGAAARATGATRVGGGGEDGTRYHADTVLLAAGRCTAHACCSAT